jgi:hypothetical protein
LKMEYGLMSVMNAFRYIKTVRLLYQLYEVGKIIYNQRIIIIYTTYIFKNLPTKFGYI